MTTISSRLTAIADDVANIAATKTAIKDAIATNLGRTVPDGTTFRNFKDHILPPAAWRPDPLWLSLDDIADNQIGMIVRDRDDLGVAARCAFTITATANYTVDWGDGTTDTIASGTMADHTYTLGAGTADSKGTTTFKVRISSTRTITRILMAANVAGGVVKQTVQNVNIKAAGITSMASAFAFCYILQSCTMVALPLCTTFAYAFRACTKLIVIGDVSASACTNADSIFRECSSLLTVGNISFPNCIALSNGFYTCFSLMTIGDVYAPKCSSADVLFNNCKNLCSIGDISSIGYSATSVNGSGMFLELNCSTAINLPNAKLSKITASGSSLRLSGIMGLTFHAESLFAGTAPQIDVQYTMMDRTALVALFNLLPTLTGKTINITGCIGTADLTAGDRAIATGKGWTITG